MAEVRPTNRECHVTRVTFHFFNNMSYSLGRCRTEILITVRSDVLW
jgi:hypothetical protein